MRRLGRALGTLLAIAGLLGVAWVITVWRWQDPFTAVYAQYEQGRLAASLEQQFDTYRPRQAHGSASAAAQARNVALAAARYRRQAHPGQAIGRIIVPRMHLNMVVVNGTDDANLKTGPGRYLGSAMPGQGRLVYIAGHRTTYLAPFSSIDQLRNGDLITLEMPYATFVYRITGHRIVLPTDVAVLNSPNHELLELQTCHPRFSATHRYIAYALPVKITPRAAHPFVPPPLTHP